MIVRGRARRGPRSGVALLWATFAAMVVFTAAFILSTLASSSKRVADLNFRRTLAEHLSLGAVAFATESIRQALASGGAPPARGTATIGGTDVTWTIALVRGPEPAPAGGSRLVSTYRVEGRAEQGGVPAVSRQIVRGIVAPLGAGVSSEQSGDPGPDPSTPDVQVLNVVAW